MSLGKDSIQKRVAAAATATKTAPAKKTTAASKATAPKTTTAKKPAAPKTSVLTGVAPETVEKVIARKETDPVAKCSLGQALPYYLL